MQTVMQYIIGGRHRGAEMLCKQLRPGSLPGYSTKGIIMKHKPRNHILLALRKRGGAGSHQKSHKQLRGKWKRTLEL